MCERCSARTPQRSARCFSWAGFSPKLAAKLVSSRPTHGTTSTLASLLLFSGALADRIGRRTIFQVGLSLFTLGMGFSIFSLVWPFTPGWPFWPAMAMGAGWAMALPLLGFLSLLLVAWYYWRLLRGFWRALDDKPY